MALAYLLPWFSWMQFFPWWSGVTLLALLAVGVADDRMGLKAGTKAAYQALLTLVVVGSGAFSLSSLGDLFGTGSLALEALAIPFTAIALLGFINAFNMIDGSDGLAGGVAVIQLLFLAALAWSRSRIGTTAVTLSFTAATAGFLVYNFPGPWRKRGAVAFLGDAGTGVLALVVGCCAIRVASAPSHLSTDPVTVAWVLALPVIDALVVIAQRINLGRNPLAADRLHVHYLLCDLGLAPTTVTYVLIAVSGVMGAFGVFAPRFGVPGWVMSVGLVFVLLSYANFATAARATLTPHSVLGSPRRIGAARSKTHVIGGSDDVSIVDS